MPTVNFQVAAEESLGSASLYLTALPAAGIASRSSSSSSAVSSDGRAGADSVDARSVFDGVSMASLVGIVRQLAQLSDEVSSRPTNTVLSLSRRLPPNLSASAAPISRLLGPPFPRSHAVAVFESLSAEVADVGRRRAAIVARVAEVEARLSRIELRTLRDTQPVRLVYAPAGSTWRFGDVTHGPVHGHGDDNIFQPGTRPAFLQWQYAQAGPQHAVGRAALPGYECGASNRADTSFKRINAERGVAGSALGEEETEALALGVAEGSRAGIGGRDYTNEATGKIKGGTGGKEEGGKEEGVEGVCNRGLLTSRTREPAPDEPSQHEPSPHEPSPHEPSPHEPCLHEISPQTPVAHETTPHAQGEGDEWGADESGARSGGNPVTVGGVAALVTAAGEPGETSENLMAGRGAALATAVGEMVVRVVGEDSEGGGGEGGGEVGERGKEVTGKEEWVRQQERHYMEEEEEVSGSMQRDDASSTDLAVENGSAECEGTSDEEMSGEEGDAGERWDEGASDEEETMLAGGGGGLLGGSFGVWRHGEVGGGGSTQRVIAAVLTCGLLVDGDADDDGDDGGGGGGVGGDDGFFYGSRDDCCTGHHVGREGQVGRAGEFRQGEEEGVLLTCAQHSQALEQGMEEKETGAAIFAAASAAAAISADFSPAASAVAAGASAGAGGGAGSAADSAAAGKSSTGEAGRGLMRRLHGPKLRQLKPWLRPDKLPLLSPSSPLSPQADEGCISPPSLALPLQAVEEEPVHASARSRSSRAHASAGVVTSITMFRLLAKGMGVFTPRQDWTVTGGAKEPKVH
ncbi:unnamed protein product [Closterium sp. NIES-53]